jgi:hypothetical protein
MTRLKTRPTYPRRYRAAWSLLSGSPLTIARLWRVFPM